MLWADTKIVRFGLHGNVGHEREMNESAHFYVKYPGINHADVVQSESAIPIRAPGMES